MKIIILGQPRSGKSTLARLLSRELSIPSICTDQYRYDWGFHEPWKGYETEIAPEKQDLFYEKIAALCADYPHFILEGNAINPRDIDRFTPDAAVLLARLNITPDECLRLCRRYDKNDWTCRRDDDYLLKLFTVYAQFARKWAVENPELLVDTSDYDAGIKAARAMILKKLNVIS